MRTFIERVEGASAGVAVSVTLTFHDRRKSRQRLRLDGGGEAALMLERGSILRDGDCLRADDGTLCRVNAAIESLSRATTSDRRALARAAYHLGNRHIPVEVTDSGLQYLQDHVLDDMVRALGLPVATVEARFHPEAGAYGGGHGHGHDHDHDHDHDHHHAPDHLLLVPRSPK